MSMLREHADLELIAGDCGPEFIMPTSAMPHPATARTSNAAYLFSKRLFDIGLALVAIIVTAPVWIVAAVLVALTSPGPVLFRQSRTGINGKVFTCLKFRTMVNDAHQLKLELVEFNETTGPVFKLRRDPRVTSVGYWLRRSSIDELPQLINIIRGDMSIVGPRPPLPEEVAHYDFYQLGRLAVKPGLTCLWQISGRSNLGFDEWIELDLEYIRRRNFWLDLWIIILTVPAVITARGAM